jgi:hypothetical protein
LDKYKSVKEAEKALKEFIKVMDVWKHLKILG